VAPLIVKADLKHLTKVYTGGESDLMFIKLWGCMVLIGMVEDRWHVEAELTSLSTGLKQLNGNTFAKLAALGLTKEEAVVTI